MEKSFDATAAAGSLPLRRLTILVSSREREREIFVCIYIPLPSRNDEVKTSGLFKNYFFLIMTTIGELERERGEQ